ncbi:hypothetical protein Tco_1093856, partial [Tanacetum coccineum]
KRGWDTKIPQSGGPLIKVGDEAVHKELDDRMERAATTASSLKVEQTGITIGTNPWQHLLSQVLRELVQETASATTNQDREMEITATIDGRLKTVTEASIRRHLKLEDSASIKSLHNAKIFEQLALMGVQSLGRDDGSMTLSELTVLCTNLSNKVTSLEAELAQTKQTYGTTLTKLIKKVKKLEQTVKSTQARIRFRIVVSDDEEEDIEIQENISDDTEVVLEEEEPTELVEDQGSGEKGEKEVSIVGAEHSTVILEVSTAAANLLYIRRSAQKRKDKGKSFMKENESIDEEERQRIARDAEIAKQLQEEINKATQEQEKQEVVTEADPTHVIDWSDPTVIRYHALQNRAFSIPEVRKNMCMYLINQGGYKMRHLKGMSYEDIRPIFEKVWDQIHSFVPMDPEMEIPKLKRAEPVKRQSTEEEKKRDDSSKPAEGRRKKTLARKRASGKDSEVNDVAIDIESLATNYLIVDWKTYVLAKNFMYYQIFRADGSPKNYKIFSEMLDDFDRQDVLDLHGLVKARYMTSSPEGYDLMLWGDLKTLFEPDEEDEVWRNQQGYNLISWRLYDSCGIHIMLMDNGIAILMMIEKKYPLNQEMLSRMLSKRLEVDHESTMAYELLSQLVINTASLKGGLYLLFDFYTVGRNTILTRYFFNHDLDFLRHGNEEKKYALSINNISVKRITAEKKYGYEYLKEILVKRAYQKEYTFVEADFTRIVIKNRVEDAQLGVETYQTKLNLTKPQFMAGFSIKNHIHLFIKGKKIGRMMFDSIDNGLLVYLTVEENGQNRPKKYFKLIEAQQLQDDCDFAYVEGEKLYEYYWRFSQLINDMHTIGMTMQQVHVNTKFLNALPPEWSKFVTDVKLTKSLYTTNYDQLKRIFGKGRKTTPKTTKLSTKWKSVKRRSKIKAKESIKPKSQQKSQIVRVKVNPDRVKVNSERLKQKIQLEGPQMPNP